MGKAALAKRGRGRGADDTPAGLDARPVVRFVVVFSGALLAFQVVYYRWIVGSEPFDAYVRALGRLSAGVLYAAGEHVITAGNELTSSFRMTVESGCDALQAMAILVIAVLAFPGGKGKKLLGALGGAALLFVLNVVRIVSLFWTGVHAPSWFETMHTDVWPAAIVGGAVLLWIAWARWTLVPRAAA